MEIRKPYTSVRSSIDFTDDPGLTLQAHKDECEVMNILAKYDPSMTQEVMANANFGYADSITFFEAQNTLAQAKESFAALPSKIRNKFENDPGQLLDFLSEPANQAEAFKLGLIDDYIEQTNNGATKEAPKETAPAVDA
jgi:phage internal scaffolding protein